MRYVVLALPTLFVAQLAGAQVLLTEIQPDPAAETNDLGEFVELHNIGTTSVSVAGWSLSDYTGNGAMDQVDNRWTFPVTATIAPNQVIIVTRQAAQFSMNLMYTADYELADMIDDMNVPNLTNEGMDTDPIRLTNGATGDGVILRDSMGMIVDWIEFGTVDRDMVGAPISKDTNAGEVYVRVGQTGSSSVDWIIAAAPSPGIGFVPPGAPLIAQPTVTPDHVDYARDITIETTITDADGIEEANIAFSVATASTGASAMPYVLLPLTPGATPGSYVFTESVPALGPGLDFPDPMSFHDRYLRFYIFASDNVGAESTNPENAEQSASNAAFVQKNVMPTLPSPIRDVVETDMGLRSVWAGHSAKISGTVVAPQTTLNSGRLLVPVEDASGRALAVFGPATTRVIRTGDKVAVAGTISQFRGTMQLSITDENALETIGTGGPVTTTTVTIMQLLTQAEELEAKLVYIANVDFVMNPKPTNWPGRLQDELVITDDSGGMIGIHMTDANELAMGATPQYGFHVRGVVTQFAPQGEFTGGYQLFPRNAEDIFAKPAPPPVDGGIPDTGMTGGADSGTGGSADSGVPGGGGNEPDEGGCNCSSSSAPFEGLAGFALLVAALAFIRRRR